MAAACPIGEQDESQTAIHQSVSDLGFQPAEATPTSRKIKSSLDG